MWFRGLRLRNDLSSSDFHLLTTAVVDLIVRNCAHFPSTFTLDYIRLRTLQVDFQTLRFQAACRWTFAKTLQMLGWGRPCPQKSYNDLYAHVSAITSDPGLIDIDLWHSCVALEIVRDVYRTCSNCELPSCKDLNFARDCLLESCKPTTAVFVDLADSLALRLHELVDREMDTIGNLSPVQIMNRQLPQKPGFDVPNEHTGLVHIAKRISHIVELHWRVWAPILYEQHIVGEGSV